MPTNTDYIRSLYHSLAGINRVLESDNSNIVGNSTVQEYVTFLEEAKLNSPGVLNNLNLQQHRWNDLACYRSGIKAHVAINLGKLKALVDEIKTSPIISTKSFHFIEDPALREILERDYLEIQKNIISENWKSSIILSGGSIEAILLDLLQKNEDSARNSQKAPSKIKINEWDLSELIDVGVDVNLVDSQIAKLSHSVREYRNLIHPGVELRKNLKVEPEEGKIAVEILNILIRELSRI